MRRLTRRVCQIGAGFTNEEGAKVAVSSPELAPAGIILDAELTLSTPERLWYAFPCYMLTKQTSQLSMTPSGSLRASVLWTMRSRIYTVPW